VSISRKELVMLLTELLQPDTVSDYCPNGLQVQGTDTISHIVTGVTASQALIDSAITANADAILVHHGYFWKGENQAITGIKYKRIKSLIDNNINLLAYHLPLDIHGTLGNNAQLGNLLNLVDISPLEGVKPTGIVMRGSTQSPLRADTFSSQLANLLNRNILMEGATDREISKVAWCTGGGQGFIEAAIEAGTDAFITGEVSEQTVHLARENNIVFYAAGHHATERYGVKALGEHIARHAPVTVEFIDIDNPA